LLLFEPDDYSERKLLTNSNHSAYPQRHHRNKVLDRNLLENFMFKNYLTKLRFPMMNIKSIYMHFY
jgi:hypothetical protein